MGNNLSNFLRVNGMHYDSIDLDIERKKLVNAMREGLYGQPSSLLMIPAFITVDNEIEEEKEVMVIDAGGTNFRVATAKKLSDGNILIDNFKKYPMPGTNGQISIDEFFEKVVDYIEPILEKTDSISAGFCFSYPVEILPSGDGQLISFSKEVDIVGVNKQLIGAGINQVLESRGKRRLDFVILNDTVAAMLSGMLGAKIEYASYIGYILGTGTNTCYLEECKNIIKNSDAVAMTGHMAINMESGMYDGFKLGKFDKELDDESQNPGDHLMEKMMGGVYQGVVIYKTVKSAVNEGFFSADFASEFAKLDSFSMMQIDDFCANRKGDNDLARMCRNNESDRENLFEIINISFERSSRIAVILFAAVIEQIGEETTPSRPVCITAEGTNFTKSVLFRPKLDRYIKEYLNEELGYYCEIVSFDDATLIGSACAALLRKN
ncbi:MAG: hexokinase [Ruminococcaceae bacterium]|mgnify:CR=1 FL=1|nr:hexokinase [Oscillospiraceae bacterium]